MQSNQSQKIYEKYRLYQDFRRRPILAISRLNLIEEIADHETFLKYKMMCDNYKKRLIFETGICILFIKFMTSIAHFRRSLSLSAPKNLFSVTAKYLLIPQCFTFWMQNNRLKQMKNNCEDLKDQQLEEAYINYLKNTRNLQTINHQ